MEQLSPDTLIQALEAEAAYQAARADLATARSRRARALYAGWRELKDARAVARDLPRSITAAAVRGAVVLLAPPSDFEQPSLFDVAAAR
jgi:hypothetical protein